PDEHITLELAQRILGTASTEAVRDLVEAVIRQDAAEGLEVINTAVDAGSDPRQFGQQVIEHLRAVLLAQTASADLVEASEEARALYQRQAGMSGRGALLRAFNEAVNDYRGGWQPQLALELALIESVSAPQETYAAPVQPAVPPAQAGAKAPQPAAPVPEADANPNAPAAIPGATVAQQWGEVQRAARQFDKFVPALMEHA